MKFWNEEIEFELVLGNRELFGIALYSLVQLYGPTTGDIVRNFDALDLLVLYGGQENIIHVDESCTSRSNTEGHD